MSKAMLTIKGFSEVKVDKIKEAARKCTVCHYHLAMNVCGARSDLHTQPSASGFVTGAEVLQTRKRCFRLSTGSKQWDAILLGGFQSGSVNEVFGEYRCGKTQLAHTLAVVAQLPKEVGGGEGKVIYIGQ